jgi:hypothetical protein
MIWKSSDLFVLTLWSHIHAYHATPLCHNIRKLFLGSLKLHLYKKDGPMSWLLVQHMLVENSYWKFTFVVLCRFSSDNKLSSTYWVLSVNIVTNMTIARQWLAKHVPERYAVNKKRRHLLDNGFHYDGITSVSVTAGRCRGICIAARTCIPVTTLR